MSKADLDRFNDFMVEYKKEVAKEYEEEIERLNNNWNELEKELEDMATLKTDEYGNTRKITHIDINWLLTKIKEFKGEKNDENK